MRIFILTSLLFFYSYEPKELAGTINIFRLWNDKNELYWSDHLDTANIKPVVLDRFRTDESLLKDADSIRVIKIDVQYLIYLK